MSGQYDSCEESHRHRVPVEESHIDADVEIREKCHREVAMGIERNSTHQVACRRAEKDGQEKIGE